MLYITIIFTILFIFCLIKVKSKKEWQIHDFSLEETLPLRGVLAVCVLLCHLCPYLEKENQFLYDFCMWGPPSVATFFLLTGYGLAYSYKVKGRYYLDGFFHKRLLRLIKPLLIMTIIFQSYKYYHGSFSWIDLLMEPSPMAWFIYALVIWYIGFYVSFYWTRNRKKATLNIWLFAMVYMIVTIYFDLNYYYLSILPLPLAITYVGYEDEAKNYLKKYPSKVLLLSMVSFEIILIYATLGQYGMSLQLWGPPAYIITPLIIVLFTYILGGMKNKFSNFLGNISYEFYIVHGFIVMLIGPLGAFGLGRLGTLLNILICILLSTLMGYLMKKLCLHLL